VLVSSLSINRLHQICGDKFKNVDFSGHNLRNLKTIQLTKDDDDFLKDVDPKYFRGMEAHLGIGICKELYGTEIVNHNYGRKPEIHCRCMVCLKLGTISTKQIIPHNYRLAMPKRLKDATAVDKVNLCMACAKKYEQY